MNSILAKIESIDSFDELANLLQSKDLIKEVYDYLQCLNNSRAGGNNDDDTNYDTTCLQSSKRQKVSHKLNVRDSRLFLTAYMIHRFPRDTLGTIGNSYDDSDESLEGITIKMSEQDICLQQKATELITHAKDITNESTDVFKFKQLFTSFVNLFNMWKVSDKEELKNALIKQYHQLSVDIMNEREMLNNGEEIGSGSQTTDQQLTEERISVLEQCKESLLQSAAILGGQELVDEVNQYSPVVIDLEELCKAYGKAFWDLLGEEYKQKKYDKIFVVLENILKSFEMLFNPDESHLTTDAKQQRVQKLTEIKEHVDVDFIRQRLQHNAYSNEDMYSLCIFILKLMKEVIAAQFDENVRVLEQHIDNAEFLPTFLQEVSMVLQITVSDTLNMRKALQNAQDHSD